VVAIRNMSLLSSSKTVSELFGDVMIARNAFVMISPDAKQQILGQEILDTRKKNRYFDIAEKKRTRSNEEIIINKVSIHGLTKSYININIYLLAFIINIT